MYQRYVKQVQAGGAATRRQAELEKRMKGAVASRTKTFVRVSEKLVPSVVKMITVGITNCGVTKVGLSSLLHRLVYQKFGQEHPSGSELSVCLKNQTTQDVMKINFISEEVESVLPKIVLMVFDLTSSASLDEINKPEDIAEVCQFTKSVDGCGICSCILIGCKVDLVDEREIPFSTAANLAVKMGAIYMEISSLTGYAVADLLDTIGVLATEYTESEPSETVSANTKKQFTAVIIGPANVGKTSLRICLTSQTTDKDVKDRPGIDASVLECKIDDEDSEVLIWDTSSNKQTLLARSLKKAQVVLFVYDVTRSSSLKELKSLYAFVKREHDSSQTNCLYMLVGNKTDLEGQVEVTDEEIEDLVGSSYRYHYRVSSLEKSGTDKLMKELISVLEKKKKYLETVPRASNEYDYLVKAVMIGDSNIGKSCLLYAMSGSVFVEEYRPTIGVEFATSTVDLTEEHKKVKLQIWDTSGDERFRTIVRSYYRGASSVVVVFDVTNAESFKNVSMWFEESEKYGTEGVHKILVGTKVDAGNRQVSYEEARDFAKTKNVSYFEVSSKTKSAVQEAMQAMVPKSVLQSQQIPLQQKPPVNKDKLKPDPAPDDNTKPDYDILLKVLFVGDSSVGKSSILQLLQGKEVPKDHLATIGVDFAIINLDCDDGSRAKIQLWDTAGQERFRSITRSYYRGVTTVVLIFDVTFRQTFENVKNAWYQEVKQYSAQDVKLILVGNKADSEDRVVLEEEVRAFAEHVGAFYFELSLNGTAGVDELKKELVPYEDDDVMYKKDADIQSESDMLLARLQLGSSDVRVALLGEPDVFDKSMLLVRMDSNSVTEKKRKRIPRIGRQKAPSTSLKMAVDSGASEEVDVVAQLTEEQPERVSMTWLPSQSDIDVALIPFDLSSLDSLAAAQRVASKVMSVVGSDTAETSPKVVLLGTEHESSERVIPREDAEQMAENLGVVYQEILAGDDREEVTYTIRNLVIDEDDNWEIV